MKSQKENLFACLMRMGQMQKEQVDKLSLQEAVDALPEDAQPETQIKLLAQHLVVPKPRFLSAPDAAKLPALAYTADNRWELIIGTNGTGQWVGVYYADNEWTEVTYDDLLAQCLIQMAVSPPFLPTNSPVYQLIRTEIFSQKRIIYEVVFTSVLINVVALTIAFYTMQVYDRVVPTAATTTLLVLTIGVGIAICYEWVAKHYRARLSDRLVNAVDQRLARTVYMRFLSVRLDQLPPSVGSLAAQVKGYETVRSFLVNVTSQVIVDAPFVIIYIVLLYFIAGNLAFIPATFFIISIVVGGFYKKRIDELSKNINYAINYKTGFLVESVEGAETIKSGQGGWRMLSRWMNVTDASRAYELEMKHISDRSQYLIALFQQTSYIALVASGATLITSGELTFGSLIASSILSGRILAPVAAIPSTLSQWSHTKMAIKSLDVIWRLKNDHDGVDQPLIPNAIKGAYKLDNVVYQYGQKVALSIPNLSINQGEKVGILGPIGSGKTSMLRLLSGMYKPNQGRIFLDNMDLSHISKPVLSEHIGYLQQEGRLFAGTLRDNLILGLIDPGDDKILSVAKLTGLSDAVITPHPNGLQQAIYEGGQGLSGGQRQLVNLTRVFLREPSIWLLDEPTASMDSSSEIRIINAFTQQLRDTDTLILVTHKADMLRLVDRVIVVNQQKVMLDGPRDDVLNHLRNPNKQAVKQETSPIKVNTNNQADLGRNE